ncbi:MAG: hypothetical protein AAF600_15895 [Bacteroidota bacterium]
MIKNVNKLIIVSLVSCTMISCSTDDDSTPITEKTSGYVLHTQVTGETTSNFVQFFDEIPSGTVDNTQGKSFPNFSVSQIAENFIVSGNITGAQEGLSQIKFDLDGEAFESAFLPTTGNAGFTGLKDASNAYFDDRNSEDIIIFNPSTMQSEGIIDMSSVYRGSQWTGVTWETFVVRDNDLFVWSRPAIAGSGSFYATDSAIVNHIDLTTGTYQSTSFFNGHGLSRRNTENWLDEQGNIFMAVTLANPGSGARPSILKIPVGSTEFDPSYEFFFVDAVGGEAASLLLQTASNFEYYKNGLAYCVVSTTFPSELEATIAEIGLNPATWTQDDLNRVVAALFSAENGQLVEINVNDQTTSIIEGLPLVSGFASTINVIDDKLYFAAIGSELNALYEYDPNTGQSAKLFDVSAGGQIVGFHKIGE